MSAAWEPTPVWAQAIQNAADPARTSHQLELLAAAGAAERLEAMSAEEARVVCAALSGSQVLGALLVASPSLLDHLRPAALAVPRNYSSLRKEVEEWLSPMLQAQDYAGALRRLREMKQLEMVRIAARDLAGPGDVPTIIREISDVADICLQTVWRVCEARMFQRYGRPCHQDSQGRWRPTPACVLGMGKLGGQELNFSSDVDVLFVYEEEGAVFKGAPGSAEAKPGIKNHLFFNKLAEMFTNEVCRVEEGGQLYRIDLRLRPEGDSGPLSRSIAGYENYYAQWGQTWERMMLIKARRTAGDEVLASEFLETIQPFRYPRSVNPNVLHEVAAMKDRIETEVVKSGELERNVKLGRGGIREVEFIVQALQLIHAGRQPFLQGSQTLPTLDKLVQYELLEANNAQRLATAYCFLRRLEHRLQMEDNRQTHTIPTDASARSRLARLMDFDSLGAFEAALHTHTSTVRQAFEKLFKSARPSNGEASPFPKEFEGFEHAWKEVLSKHGFRDLEKAFKVLREFVEGPGYVHVSQRTISLAHQLLPKLFALCPGETQDSKIKAAMQGGGNRIPLSDPDRVVTRLDSFIAAYGARATLFELWNSNPAIFELLLLLFDRSEFLAELAIRTPDLVDELVSSGRLRQRKASEETLRDLRHGLADADQHLWLRRYHQAELMRIGLRDILGLADPEQYLTELSALADACLQYALEVAMRQHNLAEPPFAIIGLGKLGGVEIDYGSDLDILFVAGDTEVDLAKLSRVAVTVLDLVSKRTEQGLLFHTDARLRPDGEKGLLVNTLRASEEYYRQRAQLWEMQALSRSRMVAGDAVAGERFRELAATLTNFKTPSAPVAAFTPDWKEQVYHMRMRIEKERTPSGKDRLAIKTGSGGLVDAEFVAQALCLEHGWHEPNTLHALERAQAAGVLPDAEALIANYRQLRRIEGILRRWSYEGETVLPDDPAPFYRVATRCGFSGSDQFAEAVADYRRSMRQAYLRFFGQGPSGS